MTSELHPDLDRSLSRRFATVADDDRVTRTAAALEANGISVLRAANAGEAKRIVLDLIPAGSGVHHGARSRLRWRALSKRSRGPVGTSPSARAC